MASSRSDTSKFVRMKIEKDENCEFCIEGGYIQDSFVKTTRIISLIERQGDHALFIYTTKTLPCTAESDLKLQQVLPVDEAFRLVREPPPKDRPPNQAAYLLGIQVQDQKYLFELAQDTDAHKFIADIQKAKAIQSQNTGFGLPSSFSWLTKYRKQIKSSAIVGPVSQDPNPFGMDAFDPLQHMKLNDSGTADKTSKAISGFDDDFSTMKIDAIPGPSKGMKTASSKDSLDFLDSYSSELTESLDKVAERELGLKPGTMADGLKPMTARETLVEYFIKERQSEFVNIETFRVFVGTWNVNGQAAGDLSEWLSCDKDPPDIYAIGFQELDLSNQAYIFSDSAKETEWQDAVWKHLHPKAKYRKVKSIRLVGVLLVVFVKDIYANHVSLIDADQVATGIMGMLGNKGGVSVRMSIHSTTLCFVNSHLAAHQDEYDRRNQDTKDIEGRMKFKQFLPPLSITDHDVVFWIGDLNYRIDLDINMVKDYTSQGLYNKMLPHDQLNKQLSTNAVYKTYTEGEINFPPTYRYDTGTDNFDSSEKKRNPAWCDRVLYKGTGIRQIIYRSHPSLRISDHKPVSALFDVGIKIIEHERYKKVYEDIMKKLDRLENDYLPQVSLAQKEFVFKDVKFVESQEQILAIANIGQVPVTFEFINKLDEDSYCRPWLKVDPASAVISPGFSCEISLEVFVDESCVHQLNCGVEKLEDILVMHLHGGKDFFIPISGNYIISTFGSSLEALVQIQGPINQLPTAQIVNLEQPGSLDRVNVMSPDTRLYVCPKEVWRLVDHIWQYGRHQEDLFRQPGLNAEIHQIRECLDTGEPADMLPGSIHSVSEALLLFLKSLADPVIPFSMYSKCLDCVNSYLLCKQVMLKVPDCHRNVFKYLCAFLRDLLGEAQHNNLDIKYLASMFGDIFLRAPPQASSKPEMTRIARRQQTRSDELKKAAFLYHFLTHAYDD